MGMEHWWNDTDRGNRSTVRILCASAALSITNPTWTDLGSNTRLHGERLATDRLSHRTSINTEINLKHIQAVRTAQ